MTCLSKIISINGYCGDERIKSLSGLDLLDAPEVSRKVLANIANSEYVTGIALAKAKLDLATILIRNDIMSVMAANNIIPDITERPFVTGVFKTETTFDAEDKERGLTLYSFPKKGKLRKTKIKTIRIYPLDDAEAAVVKIYDDYAGGQVSTYSFELIANQVNEFDVDYTILGSFARVVMIGTNIGVVSNYLTCFIGCDGSAPNPCAYTKGYYDGTEISGKEGYGIALDFSCECDYDEVLCALSKTFLGEIVWLKARIGLLDEHMRSDRLNNWIVYNRKETGAYKDDLENEYRAKWNAFINAIPSLLKQFNDSCLDCRGTRLVDNI